METSEKQNSKQKILEATSALFLEGGMPAISVRAIAKRAGLSTIGIYSHFQGKQGILDTLYIEGFTMIYDAINISDANLTPKQAVIKATENYIDVVDNYHAHYLLIFGESESGYAPSKEAQAAGIRAFRRMELLTAPVLPKHAPKRKVQRTALDIWAITHGYAGFKHHAISSLLKVKNWRKFIVRTVAKHIDNLD